MRWNMLLFMFQGAVTGWAAVPLEGPGPAGVGPALSDRGTEKEMKIWSSYGSF